MDSPLRTFFLRHRARLGLVALTLPLSFAPLHPRFRERIEPRTLASAETVNIVAAGDIAHCGQTGDDSTAALLDSIPGTVLMLGDAAYPSGSAADFTNCYAGSWGRHAARTLPVPGNHEYRTEDAAGYFAYFGETAREQHGGYYSVDLGAWHVIALNSELSLGRGSRQLRWLARDLAANRSRCSLAFWHRPRFSSGEHGGTRRVLGVWSLLYAHGVDVVLNAHDHHYERFAPQTPWGAADPKRGVRQFIVGTGGSGLRPFTEIQANSVVRNAERHGLLVLQLAPDHYRWQFLAAPSGEVLDSGTARCS